MRFQAHTDTKCLLSQLMEYKFKQKCGIWQCFMLCVMSTISGTDSVNIDLILHYIGETYLITQCLNVKSIRSQDLSKVLWVTNEEKLITMLFTRWNQHFSRLEKPLTFSLFIWLPKNHVFTHLFKPTHPEIQVHATYYSRC